MRIQSKTILYLFFSFFFLILSCQPPSVPSRVLFDEAELAYKTGQYERASHLYSEFLKSDPDPQLARLAERRSLSIEREIDNVMGKKDGPRPVYINSGEALSTPTKQSHIFVLRPENENR
ncbi:MAG: tetratricopeptide repeat protein [Bradymonadales bacterium]